MKHLSLALCAAAVLLATTPAQANFQVIRWTSGHCETWNMSIPTRPFLADYKVVSRTLPTFQQALAAKQALLARRVCLF
jgi:hypothetical protein